jgi:phosphate transport system substrate-binding protein
MLVSESHLALMQKEADEFHRLYTNATIDLLSTTTREAIVYLLNDSVHVVVTDRVLNQEEQEAAGKAEIKVTATKIAIDALAVVVNKQNPIENISLNSLREIVTRKIAEWRQVPEAKWNGPIEFAFTGRNSGAYELLVLQFLRLQEEIAPAFIASTQKEVLEYVISHPRAIGVVSAAAFYTVAKPGGIPDSTSALKALRLPRQDSTAANEFVMLHQANIYRGYYPFHYSVYILSTAQRSGLANGFSAFVASYTGQKIIQDSGLVPATMPIRLVQIKED